MEKTATILLAYALLSVSVTAAGQFQSSATVSSSFTLARIVKAGDAAPSGGVFFATDDHFNPTWLEAQCHGPCTNALAGHHPLNNDGQIAFVARTDGGCFDSPLFLAGLSGITIVADRCEDTPFGRLGFVGTANLNTSGKVVLSALASLSNSMSEDALLLNDGSAITKVAFTDDQTQYGTVDKDCAFTEPFINDKGDIAFSTCTGPDEVDGVFVMSNGQLNRLVKDGDLAPDGEPILMGGPAHIRFNNRGEVLFATLLSSLFGDGPVASLLYTPEGLKMVEKTGDVLPDGHVIPSRFNGNGLGDLNDRGQVVFTIGFDRKDQPPGGLYLYSDGSIIKIVGTGDPSPLGGSILSFVNPGATQDFQFPNEFPTPAINASGAILFEAFLSNASAPSALFLASGQAMVKVAAVGDRLDSGEALTSINTFALNDHAQVAFSAYGKGQRPLGIFLASPVPPKVTSANIKSKKGGLQLIVDGTGFITNDSTVEINGTALGNIAYPDGFKQAGGTTTRLVSTDPRLGQLLVAGQQAQVTVANPLTTTQSAPFTVAH